MKFLPIFITIAVFINASGALFWKLSYKFKFYYSGWVFWWLWNYKDDILNIWNIFSCLRGSTDYNLISIISLLDNPNFNPNQKTVLYLHGIFQDFSNERVRLIRKAYVKANYNVLVFDVNTIYYTYYVRFLHLLCVIFFCIEFLISCIQKRKLKKSPNNLQKLCSYSSILDWIKTNLKFLDIPLEHN